MIEWWWLMLAAGAGLWLGIILMSVLFVAKRHDQRMGYNR
jgi:hypothetical protein